MAGRFAGLYAGTSAPNVDPKVPDTDTPGSDREGGQQLPRPQAELLRDDGSVGLHVDRESLEPDDATATGSGRHALGDDRLERGDRAGQSQLVLQPEGTCRIRDQF